jgi:hypothetical protein
MEGRHKFIYDLESAIDCFFPILKSLQIKEDIDNNSMSVCLSYFPYLKEIDSIKKWEIVILKANLCNEDNAAIFILKLNDPQFKDSKMICYIVIDRIFYIRNEKARVIHEKRMIIAVHEFMHFLSYIYARLRNTPKAFLKILNERLSKKIDSLNNKEIFELYKTFDEISQSDNFTNSKHTRDKHFRLGIDDTPLNYTDIYRNLMLSHQLFDDYFSEQDKEKFSSLWREKKYGKALEFYENVAKRVAQEEWITEKFAIRQASYILREYYADRLF